MDFELQEVRALLGENDIALAAIPKGAVVPFRLVECPRGWRPFGKAAGRTIIGAGDGEGLTERALGERGGEEGHQLTNEELPKLQLAATDDGTANIPEAKRSVIEPRRIVATNPIEFAGQGNPHSNMQPWIALLYCEKQ
jgi:microcystin-dependent protein